RAPYPNLASVPPPPNRAMSTAERETLTQSLLADRASLQQKGEAPSAAAAKPLEPPPDTPAPPLTLPSLPERKLPDPNDASRRKPGEPPEPAPMESTLQSPALAALPAPEIGRRAPSPPGLVPSGPP